MMPKLKKKKLKKSTLKKKADILFSLFIRKVGVCQFKGLDTIHCGGDLQCAHIITRGHLSLRYDPLNALCICAGHHRWYTTHSTEWAWKIAEHFPERHNYLMPKINEIAPSFDYEEVIEKYTVA